MPLFCLPTGTQKSKKPSSTSKGAGADPILASSGHNQLQSGNINTDSLNVTSSLLNPYLLRYITTEFHAKVEDELSVLPGELVLFEFAERDSSGDWSHVRCIRTSKSGYVPSNILTTELRQVSTSRRKKMPRNETLAGLERDGSQHHRDDDHHLNLNLHPHHPHHHNPHHHPHHSHLHHKSHPHHQQHGHLQHDHHNQHSNHHSSHPHHNSHPHHPHQISRPAASSNGDNSRFSDHNLNGCVNHQHPSLSVPHSFQGSNGNQTFAKFHDMSLLADPPATYYNLCAPPTHCESYAPTPFDLKPFHRRNYGEYYVMNNFVAREENDLEVTIGDIVKVLNKDDDNWYWVERDCDHQEGFVPAKFIQDTNQVDSLLAKGNSTISMKSSNPNVVPAIYINQLESLTADQQSSPPYPPI